MAATLTATDYKRILDSLAAVVEGLDVNGYRTAPSDRWKRSRRETGPKGGTGHLDFWIGIGDALDASAWARSHITYELEISFLHRFQARTDGKYQAALHAAALDVLAAVSFWTGPNNARVTPIGHKLTSPSGEWVLVRCGFTLRTQVISK